MYNNDMDTEIEVKFVGVDHDAVRTKLKELGGECEQPMRTMRRTALDNDFLRTGKDSFVRVRDEGHRVTMTYKQFDSLSLHGAKEIEFVVSDYDKAVEFLKQTGLQARSTQETKRENWRLGDVEIMLDEWPWLDPYIEIEGVSEEDVRRVAEQLGYDWHHGIYGDVMAAYRVQYPHLTEKDTVGNIPEVKFRDPLPDILHTH